MDLAIRAGASLLWERHLMRPPAIDESCRQLAFASGHADHAPRLRWNIWAKPKLTKSKHDSVMVAPSRGTTGAAHARFLDRIDRHSVSAFPRPTVPRTTTRMVASKRPSLHQPPGGAEHREHRAKSSALA